ncbi:constitutive coactivator of peroxisome proliferator-activated receptor gamma isoform X1 [Alligator sinensis]|uniref:Constitutive coactivator of peroxisome proliferator-activated receptor gamma n=1 Tax=Alligator sinensis TaxID=38654 RepID=A0A1U7RMN4_ALLSI|nr:constitutive coactivator of peroxisome proliferator-activated receptor gamma isoform X1 [Alligator sinensis]XP_025050683.1 constitutive coactivator of peroxisome proliferator-activated receptor gamma isoform X1 [Alligator sinensis]
MGIKGLHGFVANVCHDVHKMVNLKEMAEEHRMSYPDSPPVIVVDALSCIRRWYTPESWVCGGQWQEYLANLEDFINAFTAADIKLVFFFDGVVEQKKRGEWVKRRLKNNKEIGRIFQFIKTYRQQPGRGMFFIPSGLATFTRFALKSLGQKTICSLQEADYEVASYGLQHNCMGILGQDTDYLIYNTSPYFSIEKLCLDKMVTVMYSRENLCRALNLNITDLPFFACLLGNDVVPEAALEGFWHKCLTSCPPKSQSYDKRSNIILAVANYISGLPRSYSSVKNFEEMLPLGSDKTLLCKAMESYILPGQQSPWLPPSLSNSQAHSAKQDTGMCSDQEIFQLAKEQHITGENYMVFNILSNGEVECSNTLEDELDTELPGQALIYRPARQHIYSVLLEPRKDTQRVCSVVKEWFVYFGNPLHQPELMQPVQLDIPGETPSLRTLWLGKGPDIENQRYSTFLACFHLQDMVEELKALKAPVAAVCCLLMYLLLQVDSLSLEDLNAFVAQTLCLQGMSAAQLSGLQLVQVDSRAVQLGALFIRGLATLIMANSACGFPFSMDDFMPWKVFDGKLFQEKYQQSHRGCSLEELVEGNGFLCTQFQNLKSLICRACMAKNRTIQSRQRGDGFIAEMQGRGRGANFQRAHRTTFAPPYRNQNRGYQWRGLQPYGSQTQPSGRGYRPRHQDQRRRFQFTPRWSR